MIGRTQLPPTKRRTVLQQCLIWDPNPGSSVQLPAPLTTIPLRRQMNYVRFTRLNPLEYFKDIKWSASENGISTSILCIHADVNHKSSAIHQHIVHWMQSVAWTTNQMPFPLSPSTSCLTAKNIVQSLERPLRSTYHRWLGSTWFNICN